MAKKTETRTSRRSGKGSKPVSRDARRREKRARDGVTHIKVIGVGGAGGNIISRMKEHYRIRGVEYIAVNTDAQDLEQVSAHRKINIGRALTKGLGAGMNPEIGKQAAEENRSEIGEMLEGGDIVFVVAGLGGGTGSGAAPVIASIARQKGVLTIGVITKPFQFEGTRRMTIAQEAVERLRDNIDALVIVPNERVFSVIDREMPVLKAFAVVDEVVKNGVCAIAELINVPGIINVDFADVDAILRDRGVSLIGIGCASGKDRAARAVQAAVNSPLLEASIEGAKSVLFSVAGGRDLTMSEVHSIAKSIVANLDPNAQIIFGAYFDRSLKEKELKVTVIAAGFNHFLTGGKTVTVPHLFIDGTEEEHLSETVEIIEPEAEVEVKPKNGKEKKLRTVKNEVAARGDEHWEIPAFLRKKRK
ncbi:cell division protein FtsZ [Candidatus Jorgensenbacteria bacterium GWA1_54_12]|uniref:Cell division protein FtsZ n=1 Tax=Candidatus Jorgensenbacteria bacterium GWA1_54_12 TaxID=1798468 RepID=A0A1F6BKE6_9BACT|nr:MAG: cell division protein FtsZ [Candidatus Jorgensenbacteria bacterium GWA1_54_12]